MILLVLLFSTFSFAEVEDYGIVSDIYNCKDDRCLGIVDTVEGPIKCIVSPEQLGKKIRLERIRGEIFCE